MPPDSIDCIDDPTGMVPGVPTAGPQPVVETDNAMTYMVRANAHRLGMFFIVPTAADFDKELGSVPEAGPGVSVKRMMVETPAFRFTWCDRRSTCVVIGDGC